MQKPRERERGWRYVGEEDGTPREVRVGDRPIHKLTPLDTEESILTYTNEVVNNYPMTKQEELQLIAEAQAGSRKAQTKILLKYERLCHKLARKFAFTAHTHDHDDLFQEAQIGLLSAIQTFNTEAGASFMTWAFYKVRGAVTGAGKSDRKQPRYPISIETSRRAYNVEYDNEA